MSKLQDTVPMRAQDLTETDAVNGGRRVPLASPLWFPAIRARLSGPGGLYNFGNAVALASGLTLQFIGARHEATAYEALRAYFVGSPGASWLTISILIFFVSGEVYHRAWSGRTPDTRLVRAGDALSALGAAALTVSLAYFGDVLLAIVAGTLLFGGKLGNAIAPSAGWPVRIEICPPLASTRAVHFDAFRMAVVVSRFPSLAALTTEIARDRLDGALLSGSILPAIMILCFLIWLRADLMLLELGKSDQQVVSK